MNTERQHAELSASGAHRWANCTASYQMERDLPDSTSFYAERGTFLHDVSHELLKQPDHDITIKNPIFNDLDVAEREAVLSYVYYVKLISGRHYFEQRVDFSKFVPEGFGTVDTLIYNDYKLTVIDLKTGQGVKVKAKENYQLILYALGVLQLKNPLLKSIKTIELVIHQDIIDHVDTWTISKDELLSYGEMLNERAHKALTTEPLVFRPSKDTCQFCKAKATCKPYMDYSLDIAAKGFRNMLIEPHTLNNAEIGKALTKFPALESWIKAVKEVAADKLAHHENISGFMLGSGRRSRSWGNEATIKAFFRKKRIPLKTLYNKKFISPAQAEKLGLDKYDIREFIHTSVGKPVIVRETCDEDSFLARASKGFKVVA